MVDGFKGSEVWTPSNTLVTGISYTGSDTNDPRKAVPLIVKFWIIHVELVKRIVSNKQSLKSADPNLEAWVNYWPYLCSSYRQQSFRQ